MKEEEIKAQLAFWESTYCILYSVYCMRSS